MTWLVGQGTDLWHTAVKAALLFLVAVVGFRFGERRTFAQLAPFDFVAVVSVGAIVGRTATAQDTAFLVGVVALVVVLLTHRVVARLRRHRPVAALVDQPVRLLIAEGRLQQGELRRSGLTREDLHGVLRIHGIASEADVRYLVYENKGAFSVVRWDQPVDREPVAAALRAAGDAAGGDGSSVEVVEPER
jgi:uncharacterized membrane protein YcaP (DUF421 family)